MRPFWPVRSVSPLSRFSPFTIARWRPCASERVALPEVKSTQPAAAPAGPARAVQCGARRRNARWNRTELFLLTGFSPCAPRAPQGIMSAARQRPAAIHHIMRPVDMLIQIPSILTPAELASVKEVLKKEGFQD